MKISRKLARTRGFGFIEVMLAAASTMTVAGLLCQCVATSSRMAATADVQAGLQAQAQQTLDRVMQDTQGASAIQASYRTVGGINYSAGPGTLILQEPAYAADGSVVADHYDYIVYRAVADGTDGHFTLHRLVECDASSARPASADRVVARDVAEASFTCLTRRALPSAGLVYTLTAPLLNAGSAVVRSVRKNGAEVTLGVGAEATVAGNQIVFVKTPSVGDTLDVLYVIDPLLSASDGCQVEATLRLSREAVRSRATQEVALTSTATLRNHPATAGLVPALLAGLL